MKTVVEPSGSFTHYIHNPDDPNSITKGTVWSLWDDGNGSLWISTFGGLNKLDKRTEAFTRYVHDPSDPDSTGFNKHSSVYEDSQGNLWIAGLTNGFDKMDRKTGRFKHFNRNTGFPGTGVGQTIQEDDQGFLWIGTTDAGLIKFDIKTETVEKVYTVSDGVHGNYIWRSYKTKDGKMWFSGPAGLTTFFPDQIKNNAYVPPIVLTALKQGGEHLQIGKSPELIDSIKLRWTANYFEFQFAALNYTEPQKKPSGIG